jgi:hypothetical protein
VIVRASPSPLDRRPVWPSGDLITVRDESPGVVAARQDEGGAEPPADDGPRVDWAEVERRGRWAGLLLPVLVIALGASRVLLTGNYAGLHGAAARWLLAAVVGVVLAAPAAAAVAPALRARLDAAARIQHALRAHVDPGPELRARVDVLARRSLRLRWMGRALPVLPLSVLVQTDWDAAAAVPAALVLLVAYCALALWHSRQREAAARWIAVPVGPVRPFPPVPWWEPWLGGRRLLALAAGYVVVVVAIVL